MTKEQFRELTKAPVLLDGATGSNLMLAGMPRGICTEQWILAHPDVLKNLQKEYVEAGSQIVYAPTFGGNAVNLARYNLTDEIASLNHTLVSYSKEAVQGKAYVAGDITTTGKMMAPAGDLTYEEAYDTYAEQIQYLAEAGVDLLVAETMIHIHETLAALDAASRVCDLPMMCTMTVEADGSIFTGGNIIEAAEMFEEAGACAVGVNCSVGPDQLEAVVKNIAAAVSIPVIAKPNAGMPHITPQGQAVYDMDASAFGIHMKKLLDAGASIVGGCCGTTSEYIRELKKYLP